MEPTATTDDGDHPLGPDAAAILAAEHWSLLATRTMLTSERLSRTAVFLTMLSAAIVALALVADATGFGPRTRTLALVLLPVVLLLGVATYARLVQIEGLEVKLVLAMNRLRHGYLRIAPGVAPYLSTGHHDDARGVATTLMVAGPRELHPLAHFLISTPTLVGTVDAALAAAIAVLLGQAAGAAAGVITVAGTITFLVVWGALFVMNFATTGVLNHSPSRFPSPPEGARPGARR